MLLSIPAATVHIPSNRAQVSQVPHIVPNTCYFLRAGLLFSDFYIMTILTAVRWYLTVVLMYICLMMNDVEQLFMHLFATYLSSLEKCLLKTFAHL